MQSSAAFLLPFLVLGLVLGSDLGVPVLIEYGRAEHVMCQVLPVLGSKLDLCKSFAIQNVAFQSLGLRNCHIADIDFDVLHDDSVIDVRIGGRVYARSFKNDQKDGFQVFEVGPNALIKFTLRNRSAWSKQISLCRVTKAIRDEVFWLTTSILRALNGFMLHSMEAV